MVAWIEASRSERLAMIHDGISRLPRPERTALILCWLGHRSVEQAARESGWEARSLKRRLSQALKSLRLRLGIPAGDWDSVIAEQLAAKVPANLIESTVEIAMCALDPFRASGCLPRNRKLRTIVGALNFGDLVSSESDRLPKATQPG
jgi:hypothetical protein